MGNFQNGNSLVAAIYLGTKPSSGYGVNITNVTLKGKEEGEKDSTLVIEYVTSEPERTDMVLTVLTQPHHVIEIGPLPDTVDQGKVNVRFENNSESSKVEEVVQKPDKDEAGEAGFVSASVDDA